MYNLLNMMARGPQAPTGSHAVQPAGARFAEGRRFVASLAVAALAATLLIAYLLWTARQDAISTAQVTALNYARTMEVRLDATFRRADALLQALATSTPIAALEPGAEAQHAAPLTAELAGMLREFEELLALRIIDARGEQRYVALGRSTPGSSTQIVNYADRSFFVRYQHERSADLLFSEVVMGRVSQRPTMVISRPIRDRDGRLAGAVLAPLDLGYFQQQFRKLDIGANGAVFLRRADAQGRLVLRWPHIDAEVNNPMPATQVIWRAVDAGAQEALNEYVAFTDGVPRLSGTVVVKGYPFFLTVALSQADVLASWRRVAGVTSLAWAGLLLGMSLLVWRLRRSDRERLSLERQLQEARRIESLGTLAGGIAHDFNNILAAIIGNLALARQDLGPGHAALASLEQVRKASERGRELVQQILAIGRRQPQALVGQPLQPLVEEAVALLRPTLPAGVQMTTALAAEPVHARVDATQFQQVLMNLCTNANHAMRGRSGDIEIGVEVLPPDARASRPGPSLPEGDCAHLWVRDAGSGMDAATRARIFEPFFTTKASGEGTGLGLPVVQGIVAAHGGQIRIDSEPGRGTTAHLYLPLAAAAAGATAATRALPAAAAAVPAGAGQRVLYVDDDEVVAVMVERLLQRAGYHATVAHDGAEALALVGVDPQAFDLVVTDFNMPGMSGLDLVRALATLRPDLPMLISSGYLTDELTKAADAAGVRGVLQKQNTLEELAPMVHAVLAGTPAARP
ncbi:MAG: ATP-binding protein [Rubrivivax sp.]|nr:ATP-binding protein [Rubrivivax sp.]